MEPIVRKLRNKAEVTASELNIYQLKLEQIEEKFNKEENTEIKITTLLTSLKQLKSEYEHLEEEVKSSREQRESVLADLGKNHSCLKESFENITHTLSKAPM